MRKIYYFLGVGALNAFTFVYINKIYPDVY